MRHLLASSAVAGLLFLLPAGGANAQDNRNTSWGWGATGRGGMVLSLIAAAAGAAGGSIIIVVKVLDEKLTKLEENSEENIQKLSSDLESKIVDSGSAVNMGDYEKLPLPRINKDPLAWADQELVEIERKVREMEKKIKRIPSDELMSTGDAVRHLLHVDVKEAVEKIISITGISDSQIPPYPGILDNMSIAKRWLQNTRKALDTYKLSKSSHK